MRITDVRAATVPLKIKMRNAAFAFDDMTTTVVAVVTDLVRDGRPVTGFAFNSTGRFACTAQVRDRFAPRLSAADPAALTDEATGLVSPEAAVRAMMFGEKPGGDMERSIGIGTIEVAVWDALAKAEERPLHALLAERYSRSAPPDRIFCYVGGGWYRPDESLGSLRAEMRGYLDAGYTLVKTKVGGLPLDEDRRRVDAILEALDGRARLAVDANAGLSPEAADAYADAFRELGLAWFEEPAHPADFEATRAFVERYRDPVATGENLFSREDLRNLIRYGGVRPGVDVIQTDVPQSYGLRACAGAIAMLEQAGWSAASVIPHGGNQMSLAAALGFGMGMCESYPDAFGVFSGYADDAEVVDGYLPAPTAPGVGFERQADLFPIFRRLLD